MAKKPLRKDDVVRLPTLAMCNGLHTVHAVCRYCDRVMLLDLPALIATGHGHVPLIFLPLRCSECKQAGHTIIISGQSYGLSCEVPKDEDPV